MCGRFARCSPVTVVADEFNIKKSAIEIAPSYNIAPTQDILIVKNEGNKQLIVSNWGFIPDWAKDRSIWHKMINARAETVASKPAFKDAFKKHRCLVIASGFYEWKKIENKKIPFYIHLRTGRPFGIAGLYSYWTSSIKEKICTCTIITTQANELLEPFHDRMPAIIPKEKEDLWLDPDVADMDMLLDLLRPYPSQGMDIHQVSPKVNIPKYNAPEAIASVLN
jgi:putative SOS response-associated peptidase YedK